MNRTSMLKWARDDRRWLRGTGSRRAAGDVHEFFVRQWHRANRRAARDLIAEALADAPTLATITPDMINKPLEVASPSPTSLAYDEDWRDDYDPIDIEARHLDRTTELLALRLEQAADDKRTTSFMDSKLATTIRKAGYKFVNVDVEAAIENLDISHDYGCEAQRDAVQALTKPMHPGEGCDRRWFMYSTDGEY